MKTFKSFIKEAGPNAKPKAKGEADFVDDHKVEITDPTDQATDGSAKVITKPVSGKRKADRTDNKQAMGEEVEITEGKVKELMMDINAVADKMEKNKILKPFAGKFVTASKKSLNIKKSLEDVLPDYISGAEITKLYKEEVETSVQPKTYREMMREADFSKKQTTMAHTIGKEFEKKGVGDETKGGPYAVASAMVRDKPEAAKKAYATIQSKMKEEADAELLFKLYDDLNEENQEFFMQQLEEDAEALLLFAQNLMEE